MSDTVADVKKLAVIDTIKEGIGIGMKNAGPIFVNVLLWVLTVWIPYLNVGTTIGLYVGIVSKASKGETIPMTEIFDPKYRKYMGEYFLTAGLMGAGISIGMVFFIIPGLVIALAWSLALLLVIDKGKNPTEALSISNNCTYGYKAKIFCIQFLLSLAASVVVSIFMSIGAAAGSSGVMFFMMLLTLAVSIACMFIGIGVQASIYKQLTENV